jgi:hypothetical protein
MWQIKAFPGHAIAAIVLLVAKNRGSDAAAGSAG